MAINEDLNINPEISLLTPKNDIKDPVLSIVIPALNEELTIGVFIDWCKEGLSNANVAGEILIIDSSNDKTLEIALSKGARVLKTPKRGLGRAYIDAIPYIRGKYVLMGDCDCTYDFRVIKPFIEKLDEGYEFVMGTRMKGFIEQGAMPYLHRYFGTPLTTFILNFIYKSKFSDIHCGMRAMTLEALKKINIESNSWEYASEMVLKAVKLGLKITEVPIRFYKDPEGRLSHHKRQGWFSPWYAGWINLKVMLIYSPEFFLKIPGIIAMIVGFLLVLLLINGPVQIGNIGLSLHWMVLGFSLTLIGYASLQMAILSEVFYEFNPRKCSLYKKFITYNRGVLVGAFLMFLGLIRSIIFLHEYFRNGMKLTIISNSTLLGLLALILGFQTFTFTLVFQMITRRYEALKSKKKDESLTIDYITHQKPFSL